MITCQHARQLFDRYLDGELSPSLQAELHAHQLSCAGCQSELAMLEACGDVIALDRCEPTLSDNFTDRVLLARRAQLARRPRSIGRRVAMIGTPLAAAASVMFAIVFTMPQPQVETAILGDPEKSAVVAAPEAVRKALGENNLSDEARRELRDTHEMSSGFMREILDHVTARTEGVVAGTEGGIENLGILIRRGFAEANASLVEQRRVADQRRERDDTPAGQASGEMEFFEPPYLEVEPRNEEPAEATLLDPL